MKRQNKIDSPQKAFAANLIEPKQNQSTFMKMRQLKEQAPSLDMDLKYITRGTPRNPLESMKGSIIDMGSLKSLESGQILSDRRSVKKDDRKLKK